MGFATEAYTVVDATIAASGDTTGAIDTLGHTFLAVQIPSTMTGTALSVLGSRTKTGTFVDVHESGGQVSRTFTANAIEILGEVALPRFIKLKSNQTEAAERSLVVFLKG